MELSFELTPSCIGQYYELQCDKYLIYNSVGKGDYERLGWEQPKSSINAAVLAGREWEKILLDRLSDDPSCELRKLKKDKKERLEQKDKKDKKKNRDHDLAEILRGLNNNEKPVYIYQACLGAPASFIQEYISGMGIPGVSVSMTRKMYPDFIKAEYSHTMNKFKLTVIDAKNASTLKLGAEVQITLYALLLKYLIKDENIENCYVNEDEGVVWNREKISDNLIENVFKLKEAQEEIEKLFKEKLPNLCKLIAKCENGDQLQDNLEFFVSQKCEYCGNFQKCKDKCSSEKSVKMMPYMTEGAQQRVNDIKEEGIIKSDSCEEIKKLLEENPGKLTQGCSYWNNVKNNLEAYFEGLKDYYAGIKEKHSKDTSSISFPINQDFMLIMTAQQDVNSGRVYAYSWLIVPGTGIDIWNQGLEKNNRVSIFEGKDTQPGKGTYYDTLLVTSDTKEQFDKIDRLFVEKFF